MTSTCTDMTTAATGAFDLVIPGDNILLGTAADVTELALGPNVSLLDDTTVQPTTAGLFVTSSGSTISKKEPSNLCYVDSARGRYIPQVGDLVLGTVVGQFGEYYRVTLNEYSPDVILNIYAFPNASKKNRPRLQVRELIYARVAATEKSVDAELSCIDPTTGKDGGFGVLNGGYCFNVSGAYARFLLFSPDAPVLKKMVEKLQFEIAIGVNGKVWINSESPRSTMLCVYIISESQKWKQSEISANIDKLVKKFKSL